MNLSGGRSNSFLDEPCDDMQEYIDDCYDNQDDIIQEMIDTGYAETWQEAEKGFHDYVEGKWIDAQNCELMYA